jgi:hypothetical protein
MTETKEIENISLILLLSLFLLGLILSIDFAVGILLGGTLATVNFFLLNRGIRGALAGQQKKARFFFLYAFRFIALVAIIYLVLFWKKINVAGLIVGLSSIFMGIVIHAVKNKLCQKKSPAEPNKKDQRKNRTPP